MERISQALQLPVVVERGWPVSCECELLEKLDFLRGRIARQRWILQEGLEPRLFVDGWDGFPFHEKGSFSNVARMGWAFPEAYLRRINSRTSLNKGDGGSASFLFRPSMRLRSASVANFPAGSRKKVSILS
jgi:hypothetical protein